MADDIKQGTERDTVRGSKQRWPAASVDEIAPGQRKIFEAGGRSIGLFNVNGEYRAVLNLCPHAFAPICQGFVRGTTAASRPGEYRWHKDGEILACPWHGWEFDLLTGECAVDRRRLHFFDVEVVDGVIYVMA